MKRQWGKAMLAVSVAAWGVGCGPSAAEDNGSKDVLTARKAAAPTLDGVMEDAWKKATPLAFEVTGGKHQLGEKGKTQVTLRSVYSGDRIYFLMQYKDETHSLRRSPWQKQADGSWKKLKDPEDKGGDNNLYYEDKFTMFWNISSPGFETEGCLSACHKGEDKPYGNMYTENEGERLDNWHWKSVRTGPNGQIDDQYVDSTRYDKEKSKEAGRKSDPKTGGGYVDNQTDDKKGPKFGRKGNQPAPPYWILDGEKEAFDDSKYKAGDEVPGIVTAPFAGDRGDLSAQAVWKGGVWTIEFSRKLVTGSEFDVQFDDMKKQYDFGVGIFDNAAVRHAYSAGVFKLKFE